MKTKLIAALLVAVSAAVAAPAFASGYGPAPFYRPSVGAPVSQRGQSAQVVAAERDSANSTSNVAADNSYGGVADTTSQSGSRQIATDTRSVYRGH
ncbi:hypothetical protein [Paraburkholderia sp. BCC1885]|uniref:hypothetical protein n=1 Tax=Paraburkholderia sp. BCC1885 TaxID=2562669 RepID=UPI001183A6C6|nr:hypothetical protein [Paraburkholderia sp. BCC1885]